MIEIMVVVGIIALLAGISIPAYLHYKRNALRTAFINDLRAAAHAFEAYSLATGRWPPDGMAGLPPEISAYLPPEKWNHPTQLGGTWDWDYKQFGFKAGIAVHNPTAGDEEFALIDAKIDNGNLDTGQFRRRSGGFILILEP